MFGIAAVSVLALVILLATEKAAKDKKLSVELSRKIPHAVIALAVATWPFFVSMNTVAVLGVLFTVAALVVRVLNLFPHSRWVERKSWGEVLFGLGFTISALISPNKWVFAAAVLYMGIADSLAALVGLARGKHKYKIFGHTKSIEGSMTFVLTAVLITTWVVFVAPAGLEGAWPVIFWLPIAAGIIEAWTPLGLDNLLLPVFVAAVLSSL